MLEINQDALIKLKELINEVSTRENCYLYDIEFVGGASHRILRVFIDSEAGVDIDTCANVSRGLSLLLDVNDELVPGASYELEISSPGLERPLREKWHYEKAIGKKIKVRSRDVIAPEGVTPDKKWKVKQLVGELREVDEQGIKIFADEKVWSIPLDIVHKAHIIFEMTPATKPSANNKAHRAKGGKNTKTKNKN